MSLFLVVLSLLLVLGSSVVLADGEKVNNLESCDSHPTYLMVFNKDKQDGYLQHTNRFHDVDGIGVDTVNAFDTAFQESISGGATSKCVSSFNLETESWGTGSSSFGAFLYVKQPIYSVTAKVKGWYSSDHDHNIDSYFHVSITSVDPSTQSMDGLSFDGGEEGSNHYLFFKNLYEDGQWRSSSKNMDLKPGLYYVAVGFDIDDRDDEDKLSDMAAAELVIGSYSTTNPDNSQYLLRTNPLKPEELISKLGVDLFDQQETYCVDFLNGDKAWLNEPERTEGVTYDLNNLCCGNDYNEINADFNSPIYNGDYVCYGGQGWFKFLAEEDTWQNRNEETDSYCSTGNGLNSLPSYSSDELNFISSDGADGCCGDDIKLPASCQFKSGFGCDDLSVDKCSSVSGCFRDGTCKKAGTSFPSSCSSLSESECSSVPGCRADYTYPCGNVAIAGQTNTPSIPLVSGFTYTDCGGNNPPPPVYNGCSGTPSCSALSSSSCGYYPSYCSWQPDNFCSGTPKSYVCENKQTADGCLAVNENAGENVCLWNSLSIGADVGYVTGSKSSSGYCKLKEELGICFVEPEPCNTYTGSLLGWSGCTLAGCSVEFQTSSSTFVCSGTPTEQVGSIKSKSDCDSINGVWKSSSDLSTGVCSDFIGFEFSTMPKSDCESLTSPGLFSTNQDGFWIKPSTSSCVSSTKSYTDLMGTTSTPVNSVCLATPISACESKQVGYYTCGVLSLGDKLTPDCASRSETFCLGSCEWTQSSSSTVSSNEGRYFCSKDLSYYDNNAQGLTFFDLSNDESVWKWWDAKENNVPFKIHNINNVDFISNAKEWYYCAAGGEIPNSNAKPIPEGGSFELSASSGSFRCVDTLNSLTDFFESHAGEDGYFLDTFSDKGYFSTCQSSSDQAYCCVSGTKYGEDVYYKQGKFNEKCLGACYIDKPKKISSVWTSSDDSMISFKETFCERFPWDGLCVGSLDGDWSFGLESDYTSDFVLKSDCGFGMMGCFAKGIDVDGDCEDIQNQPVEHYEYIGPDGDTSNKYEGIKCDYGSMEDGFKYCSTGLYALTGDTSREDKTFCCLAPQGQYTKDTACIPVDGDMTPAICAAIEGDYYSDWESGVDKAQCMTPIGSYDGCCIGGKWVYNWNQMAFEGLVQNDSFICYQHGDEQRIAECCTEFSTCNNYNYKYTSDSIFGLERQDNGYFTSGGTIHNLENFDDWMDVDNLLSLKDKIRVDGGVKKDDPLIVDFTNIIRDNYDWSTFKYLEFDIAYNLPKTLNITLISEYDDTNTCVFPLDDYLVNGNSTMRWHHAVIDILNKDNNPACTSNFDWSNVTSIHVVTDYRGGMSIALDAIYLSEGGDNTDDYYCTGNFGSWIKNLDGPNGDKGFLDNADMVFEDYGPYWYACESQASFDWSGHLCCGDDTYIPYNKAQGQELGEYYYDSTMGCFGGNPVYENWRLGDTLNDPRFNGILYYTGEFHECIDDNSYMDYKVSFDGLTQEPNMPLITNTSTSYTIMGSFICSPNGDWVSLDEIPRSKIIASKLYDLVTGENAKNNYDLVCDSFDQASPYYNNSASSRPDLLYFNPTDGSPSLVADFCTLSYTESGKQKVLMGLSLRQPAGAFLREMTNHLRLISGEEIDEDAFADSCTNNNLGYSTNDKFFKVCDIDSQFSGLNLRMAYNPDFKILFITYENNENEFNELFEPGESKIESFYENFVDALTKLFTKLFRSAKPNDEFVITTENNLPRVLNDSATYDHIYLSKDGSKQIQAFKTKYAYQNTDVETINIEYYNFNTIVKPLALNYYNTRDYSINYMRGVNKQIINIDKPIKLNSFEQDFDWRTLTTQLKVDATDFGSKITSPSQHRNDGLVDEDELCDFMNDNSGGLVFKYPRTDCYFWNSSYKENCGTVGCDSIGRIKFDDCNANCISLEVVDDGFVVGDEEDTTGGTGDTQADCGDGICNGDETCSTCSQDCGDCGSSSSCGDGHIDDGEDCDDLSNPTLCDETCHYTLGICRPASGCIDYTNGYDCEEVPNCNWLPAQ